MSVWCSAWIPNGIVTSQHGMKATRYCRTPRTTLITARPLILGIALRSTAGAGATNCGAIVVMGIPSRTALEGFLEPSDAEREAAGCAD